MTSDSYSRIGPDVFLDISIGGNVVGRLIFKLFYDVVPKTANNFKCLCTGESGIGRTTGKPLHYRNTIFHRIIRGFMCQSGDFSNKNGTGGESIYGGKFSDENFIKHHNSVGKLSMANSGPNSNGSQFFVTLKPTPHLDGKHVVFGELISGLEILRRMETVSTGQGNKPVFGEDVMISNCGIVEASNTSTMLNVDQKPKTEKKMKEKKKKQRKNKGKKEKKEKKEKKQKDSKDTTDSKKRRLMQNDNLEQSHHGDNSRSPKRHKK